MTQAKATPRTRARGLKTWSAFGNLGRRPSEYEILTHNLNHTTGPVPLELGPDTAPAHHLARRPVRHGPATPGPGILALGLGG